MSQMNMIEAIRSAHDVMLEKDPSVIAFGQDIGFFGVGDCAKDIGLLDIFFSKNLLVRCIPRQNDGLRQLGSDDGGALLVPFDQLYVVGAFKSLRQLITNIAATRNDNFSNRVLELSQLAHHDAQILSRGDEKYDVMFSDDCIAFWQDTFPCPVILSAINGCDASVGMRNMAPQLPQLLAYQQATTFGDNTG